MQKHIQWTKFHLHRPFPCKVLKLSCSFLLSRYSLWRCFIMSDAQFCSIPRFFLISSSVTSLAKTKRLDKASRMSWLADRSNWLSTWCLHSEGIEKMLQERIQYLTFSCARLCTFAPWTVSSWTAWAVGAFVATMDCPFRSHFGRGIYSFCPRERATVEFLFDLQLQCYSWPVGVSR